MKLLTCSWLHHNTRRGSLASYISLHILTNQEIKWHTNCYRLQEDQGIPYHKRWKKGLLCLGKQLWTSKNERKGKRWECPHLLQLAPNVFIQILTLKTSSLISLIFIFLQSGSLLQMLGYVQLHKLTKGQNNFPMISTFVVIHCHGM